MATVYEIRFGSGDWQTAAALGIENVELTLRNAGTDALAFEVVGDCLAASLAAYNSIVRLRRTVDALAPECLFVGTLVTLPRIASPDGESMQYLAVGAGYALEKLTFEQQWQTMRASDGELVTIAKPRVVLGQADDGTRLATGAQIRAIVEFARTRGKLVALGTVDDGIVMPYDERDNLKCADAIAACLRWHPDWSAWWNYDHVDSDTGEYVPAFNARAASNLTAVDVPVQAVDMETLELTPRYDLQVPGVRVVYETSHELDGRAYPSTVVDVAGDADHPDALTFMFDLEGSKARILRQEIETAEYVVDDVPVYTTNPWWRLNMPGLVQSGAGSKFYTITATSRSGALDLPRYLVSGTIQPWMGVQAERETITATGTLVTSGADNVIRDQWTDKTLALSFTSTDAVTGEYTKRVTFQSAEPVPVGVALSVYTGLSRLHFDGRFGLVSVEPSFTPSPSSRVNLSGADPAWASMDALVQDVSIHIDTGTASVVLGPCKRLGADDHVAIFQAARTRRNSVSALQRTDATAAAETADGATHVAKSEASVVSEGLTRRIEMTANSSSQGYAVNILLDPANAAAGWGATGTAKALMLREFYVLVREVILTTTYFRLVPVQMLASAQEGTTGRASLTSTAFTIP